MITILCGRCSVLAFRTTILSIVVAPNREPNASSDKRATIVTRYTTFRCAQYNPGRQWKTVVTCPTRRTFATGTPSRPFLRRVRRTAVVFGVSTIIFALAIRRRVTYLYNCEIALYTRTPTRHTCIIYIYIYRLYYSTYTCIHNKIYTRVDQRRAIIRRTLPGGYAAVAGVINIVLLMIYHRCAA